MIDMTDMTDIYTQKWHLTSFGYDRHNDRHDRHYIYYIII